MKAKFKQVIPSILATIAFIFIIISSIVQWVPDTYYQTAREAKYTMSITTFLQNSTHFAHYIDKQNEEAQNEKN